MLLWVRFPTEALSRLPSTMESRNNNLHSIPRDVHHPPCNLWSWETCSSLRTSVPHLKHEGVGLDPVLQVPLSIAEQILAPVRQHE